MTGNGAITNSRNGFGDPLLWCRTLDQAAIRLDGELVDTVSVDIEDSWRCQRLIVAAGEVV